MVGTALGLSALLVGCSEPTWRLDVDNRYAPCELRIEHGSQEVGRGTTRVWDTTIQLPELTDEEYEQALVLSVASPDGWVIVPTRAVRRITGNSIAVAPQTIDQPVIQLCVDNRGGPATTLTIGELSLPIPANAATTVHGIVPPREPDAAGLLLGGERLGTVPSKANLGNRPAALVIDPTGQRHYRADYARYSPHREGSPPLLDTSPRGERWAAARLHRIDIDLMGLDQLDCMQVSPEQKEKIGNRLQILEEIPNAER